MPRLDLWIWWRPQLTPPNFESVRFNLQYLLPIIFYLLRAALMHGQTDNCCSFLPISIFSPRLSTVRLLKHCLSHVDLMRYLNLVCCGSDFFKMPGSKTGSRAVVSNLTIWDSLRRFLFLAISCKMHIHYRQNLFYLLIPIQPGTVLPWGTALGCVLVTVAYSTLSMEMGTR